MDLTLKLFAVLKDKAGADSVTVRVREGATTAGCWPPRARPAPQ